MNSPARLLPLLALLFVSGCLGQSGAPPACATHCLCDSDYQRAPLRGRVLQLVPLEVEVVERPADGGYDDVSPGTIVGGEQPTCEVAPKVDVGDYVLAYYERGEQDGSQCREFRACNQLCENAAAARDEGLTEQEQIQAYEEYEACLEACPTSTALACGARREEALFGGSIRLAVETDEGYDFGVDIRGRELLLHEDELIELSDASSCYEFTYPDGCNDQPGPFDL